MVRDSELSGYCLNDRHDLCPHPVVATVALTYTLCDCGCHNTCALAYRVEVGREEWDRSCTCGGSDELRRRNSEVVASLNDPMVRMRKAVSEVDLRRGRSARDIKADLDAAFDRNGIAMGGVWTELIAGLVSAATGRRALAIPRTGIVVGKLGYRAVQGIRTIQKGR